MASEEWTTPEHANRYLALADSVPHRAEGEGVLAEQVPRDARRILDLGTGDGRLLALLQRDRPDMLGVGLDWVRRRTQNRTLPHVKVGRKVWFAEAHVHTIVRQLTVEPVNREQTRRGSARSLL